MHFVYDPSLDGLLSSIETTLVAGLPPAVRDLCVTEPCYALFIWYDDSASIDFTPRFGLGTESVLKACAGQYADDDGRIDCVWRPQQTLDNHRLIRQHKLQTPGFSDNCNLAYKLLLDANKSPLPLPDESGILLPFRSMLRRVAATLNNCNWSDAIAVDESFVVVALDSVGYWLEGDLDATIPRSVRARLVERRLLVD